MYGFADDILEKILAMFNTGEYSINDLARIFKRDSGYIRDIIQTLGIED